MKTLILILFSISLITNTNAQTNPDPKTALLDLLKSKHDYERVFFSHKQVDLEQNRTKYLQAFAEIKEDQDSILWYIKNYLQVDTTQLSKKRVLYEYESLLSSRSKPKNTISLLTYFRIVRYSLENSRDMLPPLSELLSKRIIY